MGGLHWIGVALTLVGCFAIGCGNSHDETPVGTSMEPGLTGTAFGEPFVGRDTLLVHPQRWKSADAGSTAILISDTADLCAQITSGKTTAPGRLAIISLQENGADGSVVDLSAGQFEARGQGTPSSRFGDVFLSKVDAQCGFDKLATDRSSIQVTAVGEKSSPVSASIDVHFTNGDALRGSISASVGCDEVAVDEYLNHSPKCN